MSDNHRRSFLKQAFAGAAVSALNPYQAFVERTLSSLITQSFAQSASPKKLIYFHSSGAPPRWMFDQVLNSNGEALIANGNVANKFIESSGRYVDTTYATHQYKGIHLPHMWSYQIPVSAKLNSASNITQACQQQASGSISSFPTPSIAGRVPLTKLADNFLCLRGLDTRDASHESALAKQFQMPGAALSLSGVVADAFNSPISAISINPNQYRFSSSAGKTHVELNSSGSTLNLISKIMNPFQKVAGASFRTKYALVREDLNNLLNSLDSKSGPLGQSIGLNRKYAEELIQAGLCDLNSQWNYLVNKYKQLITASFQMSMPGINDLAVGATGARDQKYDWVSAGTRIDNSDLRTLINSNMSVGQLAESCALAEYMIVNNYSSSLALNFTYLERVNATYNGSSQIQNTGLDMHFYGVMPVTYLMTQFYMGFSSCLYELISVLKTNNLFNDTAIVYSGEFNRSPRNDGSGSDHADKSHSVSIWSGAVNGPKVIGNVVNQSYDVNTRKTYGGSWGEAAKLNIGAFNNEVADGGNALSTIANILNVPSPNPFSPSLVTSQNGQIVSAIGDAKVENIS